jgi:lysophospholipase L1-like esterase
MRILFQGDSITDGNRIKDNEWDLNHQIGHSYAYLITASLGARHWGRQLDFVNRGVSGNRIVDLYSRLQQDVLNQKPDVLSILIGVNDVQMQVNSQQSFPYIRYEKVFRILLDEVFEILPDCKVILCEPFILPVGQVKERFEQWYKAICCIQEVVYHLAQEYRTVYVALQDRFSELAKLNGPEYWMWDGIHPTVAGHQIIADAWLDGTEKIMNAPITINV